MVINTQGAALGWQCNGLSGRCISYPQRAALGWQCNGLSDRCISYPQGVAVGYGNGNEQPPRRATNCQPNGNALGINER